MNAPKHYRWKVRPSDKGKVHWALKDGKTFDPYCNHMTWRGDYWGKSWEEVDPDTEVTCGNCLRTWEAESGPKFKLPETPKVAVDALIVLPGVQIVLIERKFPPLGFALPGGFMDIGESAEDAVHREVLEETSLLSTELKLIGVFSDPDRDPRGHIISLAYALRGVGTPKARDDAKAIHVMPIARALGTKMIADHKKIIITAVRYGLHLRR